ncbi:hypothetical protein L6164_026680 [Bauhinia variegata]|uniref:Uncharacterized protein n=1 Tax=Bauhinia variegata TaxID=167791 RepID=A0ACB9LRA4_BAUVA|nr:hypothetical protein L6164_026680 [Bauhinia variegata]
MTPPILAEYISAATSPIRFYQFPNREVVPVHFVVTFATDKGDGNFEATFHEDFNERVLEYQKTYPDTKFILSIGDSDGKYPFKGGPHWVDNATKGIERLIEEHNLSGIDIHYSKVADGGTDVFAGNLGDLIKNLKKNKGVDLVLISPTPTCDINYQQLYKSSQANIDYVNYRFYDLDKKPDNKYYFKNKIDEVVKIYANAKLLLGNKTYDASKGKIEDKLFFDVFDEKKSEFRGISAWSADESPDAFQFEKEAQDKLKLGVPI